MRVFVPLALFLSLVGGAAAAQQEMLAPRVPEPAVAAPAFVPTTQAGEAPALRPQRQGDINFISGGASADDRAALQAVAAKYNMRLMFAMQPGGAYLADVGVTLVDAGGHTVLDTIAGGPLFYALVPPGTYSVTVSNAGHIQRRQIQIAASGAASQSFYWHQTG
jgi:hypothetical protein